MWHSVCGIQITKNYSINMNTFEKKKSKIHVNVLLSASFQKGF